MQMLMEECMALYDIEKHVMIEKVMKLTRSNEFEDIMQCTNMVASVEAMEETLKALIEIKITSPSAKMEL